VIGLDTNLLVYAYREDSPWHDRAYTRVVELAEGRLSWAIPWPCLHEFIGIITHPRIYTPPTPLAQATDQIEACGSRLPALPFCRKRTVTGLNFAPCWQRDG